VERESYREWLEMQGRPVNRGKPPKTSRSKSATPSPPYRPATQSPSAVEPPANHLGAPDQSASSRPPTNAFSFKKAPNVTQLIAGE